MTGCVVGGEDAADAEAIQADPDFLAALNDGWPADPAMYELKDVECVTEPDRIIFRAVLVNRAAVRWAFSPQFVAETTSGEVLTEKSGDAFWEPGQEISIDNWFGGSDFDDPPRCEIKVLHSAILAWQDDEATKQIYDVLDWNP